MARKGRLISFEFSTTQTYMIAATHLNLAIFREGVLVADVPTPYSDDDLAGISWSQNLDTLLIFHEDHPTKGVVRQGAHDEWHIADWAYTNIPTYDYGSGAEPVISATRGWPRCGAFFQGRLYVAGLKGRPSTILATKAGSFTDLDTSTTDADFGLNVTALGDQVASFHGIFAGRHLQFFASSSEFYVPVSENEAITPTNFVLRETSNRGSQKGVRPFSVDGATMFLQRGGKSLREFLFVDSEAAYQANNLSLLASHLVRSPTDMALRRSANTDDADYVWLVNSDGTMAAFCTLRLQDINAWTLQSTDGPFVAVNTILEETYVLVDRTVQGTSCFHLERFDADTYTDAHMTGGAASSASGLDYIEGETVEIRLDGVLQNNGVVSGGSVTFDRPALSSWEVGIPFPDVTADFDVDDEDKDTVQQIFARSMPAEEALPEGTQIGRKKRAVNCTVLVKDTLGLKINGNFVATRKFGSGLLDTTPATVTGEMRAGSILGWTDNGYIKLGQEGANPLNVLGLAYKLGV